MPARQRKLFSRLSFKTQAGPCTYRGRSKRGRKVLAPAHRGGPADPTEGDVTLTGMDADASLKEQLHYLGHDDALRARSRAGEPCLLARCAWRARAFARRCAGKGGARRARPPAGLGSVRRPKRRLAIARLLVSQRPLWVLDEPTTALDVTAQARFAELARDHLSCGGIILAGDSHAAGFRAERLRTGGSAGPWMEGVMGFDLLSAIPMSRPAVPPSPPLPPGGEGACSRKFGRPATPAHGKALSRLRGRVGRGQSGRTLLNTNGATPAIRSLRA